jgi:hypothetical protein
MDVSLIRDVNHIEPLLYIWTLLTGFAGIESIKILEKYSMQFTWTISQESYF